MPFSSMARLTIPKLHSQDKNLTKPFNRHIKELPRLRYADTGRRNQVVKGLSLSQCQVPSPSHCEARRAEAIPQPTRLLRADFPRAIGPGCLFRQGQGLQRQGCSLNDLFITMCRFPAALQCPLTRDHPGIRLDQVRKQRIRRRLIPTHPVIYTGIRYVPRDLQPRQSR